MVGCFTVTGVSERNPDLFVTDVGVITARRLVADIEMSISGESLKGRANYIVSDDGDLLYMNLSARP